MWRRLRTQTGVIDGRPTVRVAPKFRIKIWDKSSGDAVVYDNVPGAPEDIDIANPQAISAGSIVIHKEQ